MSKLSTEQILSNIYYDLERGYGSAKSLYEQAKEEGAVITLEEVKNFMKKQPNKQIKGYQNYNSYLLPYARAEFQIDIMDMNKFKQEGEERYGLIVHCVRTGARTFPPADEDTFRRHISVRAGT